MNIDILMKLAEKFEELSEVKKYRKDKMSENEKKALEKLFEENEGEDLDVSCNDQHFGWFEWNDEKNEHEQTDMNDFNKKDDVKDVQDFVGKLKKVVLKS